MKKIFILFLTAGLLLLIQNQAKAQEYKNAIGGRFGVTSGVTFKTFLTESSAIDFILGFRSNKSSSTFRLTGLYEIHTPVTIWTNTPGLSWYYGAGGSIGSIKDKETDESDFALSLDGVLGLDYKFTDAPVNLSLDWKPAINIAPETNFDGEGLGLSLRYTF